MTRKTNGRRVTTPTAANDAYVATAPIVASDVEPAKPDRRRIGMPTFPKGRAHAGPPAPGRTRWLIVVLTCPWCGGMHHHRVTDGAALLAGKQDRICPTTGEEYTLSPVQRRKEARRRG